MIQNECKAHAFPGRLGIYFEAITSKIVNAIKNYTKHIKAFTNIRFEKDLPQIIESVEQLAVKYWGGLTFCFSKTKSIWSKAKVLAK